MKCCFLIQALDVSVYHSVLQETELVCAVGNLMLGVPWQSSQCDQHYRTPRVHVHGAAKRHLLPRHCRAQGQQAVRRDETRESDPDNWQGYNSRPTCETVQLGSSQGTA